MLVIRRRAGQSVWIGDNVRIEVVEIAPNRVKLGISAPTEITVLRDEIRLTGETNQAAARAFSRPGLTALLERCREPEQGADGSDKNLPR